MQEIYRRTLTPKCDFSYIFLQITVEISDFSNLPNMADQGGEFSFFRDIYIGKRKS